MKIKLLLLFLLSFLTKGISQNALKESLFFGVGMSNFIMNGDLKFSNSLINTGGYLYISKMVSPELGFELRYSFSDISGKGNDPNYSIGNTTLNNLYFKGESIGGELNIIYNLSNLFNIHNVENRRFNYSTLLGMGIHQYNSKLYNSTTNELIADFGNGPSNNGTTGSLFYTLGLNVKYKLTEKIDIELRQNFNINEEDHLDAVVSNKSSLDYYFKTNVGVVFNLNRVNTKSFTWNDYTDTIQEKKLDLTDSDNDGVIDQFDIEENTPEGAEVYGNGVAIDADKDGVIDFYDKCHLEYAKTKTGCKEKVKIAKVSIKSPLLIIPKTTPLIKEKITLVKIKLPKVEPKIIIPLTKEELYKQKIINEVNKNNVKHDNVKLDNSVNISDIETSPIYPDCANEVTQFDKTNCIVASISNFINKNYNKDIEKVKGKVRVLFIVKEDGSTEFIKVLGEYGTEVKHELKRVLETLPKIEPGKLNGVTVPVKYSLLFYLN